MGKLPDNTHNADEFDIVGGGPLLVLTPELLAIISMAADLVTWINNSEENVNAFMAWLTENTPGWYPEGTAPDLRHERLHQNIYTTASVLRKLRDENGEKLFEYMISRSIETGIDELDNLLREFTTEGLREGEDDAS